MVRSIGELELERGSGPMPTPFEGWEKKLEIIGCLNPAPLFCVDLDSGCRIAARDYVNNDASGVATPRGCGELERGKRGPCSGLWKIRTSWAGHGSEHAESRSPADSHINTLHPASYQELS